MRVWLSPTKLSLFNECERCGYDDLMKITKRPWTPFASLPNGLDREVKRYLDDYRGTLPTELAHLTGHRMMDEQSTINTYRDWKGLKVVRNITVPYPSEKFPDRKVTHTVTFNGGIDDALYNQDNEIVPFDIKSKDKEPDEDYGERYYTTQINSYAYLFKENCFKVANYGYLWYWWPAEVEGGGMMQFGQKLLKMPIDLEAIPKRIDDIVHRLPSVTFEAMQYRHNFTSSTECGFCNFVKDRNENDQAESEVEPAA